MAEFVVLVTGSRDWCLLDRISAALAHLVIPPDHTPVLVHGGAAGADTMADQTIRQFNNLVGHLNTLPTHLSEHLTAPSTPAWTIRTYLADWKTHGRSAGPRRNTQMVQTERPHVVLAFRRNDSKGTTHALQAVHTYARSSASRLQQFIILDDRHGVVTETRVAL